MRKTIQINSIYTYFVVATLVLAVAVRGGASFGLNAPDEEAEKVEAYTIDDVRAVFPDVATFSPKQGRGIVVKNNSNEELGRLLLSSDFDVRNIGYAGEVPLFIVLDKQDHVAGIHLLPNEETADYIEFITERKLLQQWNGLEMDTLLLSKQVDAISGATYSSQAIIKTVNETASAYLDVQSQMKVHSWLSVLRIVLTFMLVAISIGMVVWHKFKKLYWYFLAVVVIVFGFWFKQMLSIGLLHTWLVQGVSIRNNIELIVLLLLSIVLSILGYRKYYCTYLCPMGALQMLASKVSPFKKRSFKLRISVVTLRAIYLTFIWVTLLLGFSLPLFNMEPFVAFSIQVASTLMLVAGAAIVVLSLFFNRPWCQLCPTGCLLDSVPSIKKSKKDEK